MKDFRCSCTCCGKTPGFGRTEIWIQSEGGMLCETCWRAAVGGKRPVPKEVIPSEHEFCCFCSVCKRTPPDPEYKIWIETEKGCICEKCWKEAIGAVITEKTEPAISVERVKGPVDIQFGCCQINKKLLLKSLDMLPAGADMEIIAENSDVVKQTVKKYVEEKGCTVTGIDDQNGTCLITIKRF